MLSNKLALVTGAASGIGLEVSKLFAREGAVIVAVDLTENVHNVLAELEVTKDKSTKHSAYMCDVSNSENVKELFKKIKTDYPKQKSPNVVVNCAGVLVNKPFLEMTEALLDRALNINLKGTFHVSQAACRELAANFDSSTQVDSLKTNGSIINIASLSARMASQGSSAYSMSKAGVEALSRSIAKEMGIFKIRCNTISPGYTLTPMNRADPVSVREVIASKNPLQRCAEPKEIAQLCLFLASDMSSYMTGAYIASDGGLSIALTSK